MEITQLVSLPRALARERSRRGVFGLLAGSGLSRLVPDEAESRKKHKKRKKPTCGKNGEKPIKGKCCATTITVGGTCRTCDVCASGCAFATLQPAVDAASAGATLAVCPGTYAGGLTIAKNLQLIGDSNEGSDTIVQGAADIPAVKTISGTITLQNLRLTGSGGDGAGLYIEAGTVSLIGCTINGNGDAGSAYGAIYNNGSLQLTNTTVRDNTAVAGGGVYNAGPLRLTNSVINGNAGVYGGGIYHLGGSVIFDSASRVTGNSAINNGGGIYTIAASVTLASSANVSGNTPNNCAGTPAIALCSG
ncbi:MAG: right-handed parallel beta-helix repeat-containing protein [Thermomicrobiales bacterium]